MGQRTTYGISSSGTVHASKVSWCIKKLKAGRKEGRTAIDDDALRHDECRVGRHLHGAKMTRRDTQRTQLGRAISWRVVTCPHMGNKPSKNIAHHASPPRHVHYCILHPFSKI